MRQYLHLQYEVEVRHPLADPPCQLDYLVIFQLTSSGVLQLQRSVEHLPSALVVRGRGVWEVVQRVYIMHHLFEARTFYDKN
jgi:hypothetical protein